jgi:hypothetical protein
MLSIPQENGTYLHKKISNDAVGFKSIIKHLSIDLCVVMEATQ